MLKEKLLDIIKSLNGSVFTLGITDQDLIREIQNNKNIDHYLMLNINENVQYEDMEESTPVKNIKISKIKKKNKKKKVDYSICEISDCKDHFRTFINDTIYFNKNTLYYYGNTDVYDLDLLVKKYRRYNVNIEILKFSNNEFIMMIDTKKAKTNKFKTIIYKIVDFFELIYDLFTSFLLS